MNANTIIKRIWFGLRGLAILSVIFLAGEYIASYIDFPIPGAVIGMFVVFVLLQLKIIPLVWVDSGSTWLLTFMGLFYVPYGVGIIESGQLLEEWGMQIILLILVTVLSVFACTGWLFQSLTRYNSSTDE